MTEAEQVSEMWDLNPAVMQLRDCATLSVVHATLSQALPASYAFLKMIE